MREECCCRERRCISGNGHFLRLKLVEAEVGQLLIMSLLEGMIDEIMPLMKYTSDYHLSEVGHKIIAGSNSYLCVQEIVKVI